MGGDSTVAPTPGAVADHPAVVEVVLRVVGAALHILATLAIVHRLDPEATGIYFRGFVIACGLAAFIRGKYELYMAHHLIGGRILASGVADGALLLQLGRRVLLRASLVCGALLVVTADLDIQTPRLQPTLETYLPFVLAIPCVSISTFIGEALRAANRTLLGTVITAYSLNICILLAVALAPPEAPLFFYSWAFLVGSFLASVVAVLLASRAFPAEWNSGWQPIGRKVLHKADQRALVAIARAALFWGPLCVLAIAAPAAFSSGFRH